MKDKINNIDEIKSILKDIDCRYNDKYDMNHAYKGLRIVYKYIKNDNIIINVDMGVMESVTAEELFKSGITISDCIKLHNLGWWIYTDNHGYSNLKCCYI